MSVATAVIELCVHPFHPVFSVVRPDLTFCPLAAMMEYFAMACQTSKPVFRQLKLRVTDVAMVTHGPSKSSRNGTYVSDFRPKGASALKTRVATYTTLWWYRVRRRNSRVHVKLPSQNMRLECPWRQKARKGASFCSTRSSLNPKVLRFVSTL